MVECLTRPRGRGFEPHRHHCVVSLSKNINPSLVLVQPRKTRPFITERFLMGRKKNQIKTKHGAIKLLDATSHTYYMSVELLTEHHLEFLSLKTGSSESTHVKIPHSWKSHVVLFDLILYVPSTIFQLYRDGFSWVEPVLCLFLFV